MAFLAKKVGQAFGKDFDSQTAVRLTARRFGDIAPVEKTGG
jgi:hypothetical protein